jgi:hypothetical protein
MKTLIITVAALMAVTLHAQEKSKVYLDPGDPFSAYFASALEKKNVPVVVTTDPQLADYIVKFQANDSNGSIVRGISSAVTTGNWDSGAFNEVSMRVIDNKSKDVTFSYTCKKYDRFSAADSPRASSVAECLAKHWKSKFPKQ